MRMMKTINKRENFWLPMILVQVYLSVVFILFVMGPWDWPITNKLVLYTYILAGQICLAIGYGTAVKSNKIRVYYGRIRLIKLPHNCSIKIIRWLILLSLIMIIPKYIVLTGNKTFDIINLIDSFIKGIIDPGKQYYDKIYNYSVKSSQINLVIIIGLTAPLRWLSIPLGIINWKQLKLIDKINIIILIVLDLMTWISIGTNKGIFDNVFIISTSLFIKNNITPKKEENKGNKKNLFFFMSSISIAILYMTNAILSRMGSEITKLLGTNIKVDLDKFIISSLPDFLLNPLIVVSVYITQGYYGLSLAMREKFTSTYGIGNSFFTLRVFEELTGNTTLINNTYPYKIIKYGWDPMINWHSFYTWMASDYSFIGVLFIMIIIGYLFGEVWKSIIMQKNIYAIGLFMLFCMMFIYLPANNQVFAFIDTFFAFWILMIMWIISAKINI